MSARASTHSETRVEVGGLTSIERRGVDGFSITLRDAVSLFYALKDELVRTGSLVE